MKIIDLGKTDYLKALKLQEELFKRKIENPELEDVIFITEHNPVYTLGKTTQKNHLLDIPENIPVYPVERGGSVTFHGEGQLVVYPVLNLKNRKVSIKNFVWALEEIMIRTLYDFNIKGYRRKKLRGVFTEKGKIGFVGIKISQYVSYHGFSLNVNVDKNYFNRIIPCGITDTPVCNISDFLQEVNIEDVKLSLINHIKEIL
ncbi:lipoyl(octanoyl) transferase [Persephonella hydrogeniphila]|uniref:Octanoyltransferase n=1 Tax=Persephonella hydrogeniphila TaxID=198703 RepID=A0A285NM72_9AQUI|nr:lipoyl(octanoyl) transferase LipB [Persephonella hydrogeniphila]SNZ08956.1 lipoyl(octanoyl) transferase [Persephonella hydrogeniphila]